jgi:chromosome segregation ATPase
LTQDEDRFVRSGAADALGKAFSQVPDKSQAWQDLNKLTQDKNWFVRMRAYDSLGRASISKATESIELNALKNELENAINYFKKSHQESKDSPAKFCYTFYRSYLAIIFQEAKEQEVQKYLAEAQDAVGGSKSKDELFKAVENLARALQEAQRLKDRPFHEVVSELNTYRWFCEKAAEHMNAARDNAPGAVKLMKKCNPLLEDRIQSTIAEIQKSARDICESTHGSSTEYEALGAELQKAAKGLSTNDIAGVQNSSSKIVWQLKKFCHLLPPEDKEQVCTIVEEIGREAYYPDKLNKILIALLCLGPILESKPTSSQKEEETLQRIEAKLDVIHDNTKHLGLYLSNIEFAILKLKDSSGDAREHLFNIKNEIGKLQREIETQGLSEKELAIALENNDHALIERLTKMQEDISRAVRETTELNANKIDAEEILNELDEQNKLKKGDAIGIISDISQLLQIALKFYQTGSII